MRIEYHRTLVADHVRNRAFHDALAKLIVPGETTVADIGAGTGLLGFIAARLGARRVFLYESAEVAGVAEAIRRANRLGRCEVIPAHSSEVLEPERVDLVVSETLGNYAFEENILATLDDARRRFLKPGGRVVPRHVRQLVCPVTAPRFHEELTVWDRVGFGLDLSLARTMSLNNIYVRSFAAADLLAAAGAGSVWDEADLTRRARAARHGSVRWTLEAPATVHGFALWWEATLADGIALSTAPSAPRTHWEQLYLPALEPVALAPGAVLTLDIASRSSYEAGTTVRWTLAWTDGRGRPRGRQSLDLEKGFLP